MSPTNLLSSPPHPQSLILYSSESGVLSCPNYFILNDTKMCKTAYVTYVGLPNEVKFSFKNHISDLCNSCVRYKGIFYRFRTSSFLDVAIVLHYSLVFSKLSYEMADVASAASLKPFEVLQNRIITSITFSHRWYPTIKLHINLEILTDIHTLRMCTFVYSKVHNKLPHVLLTSFTSESLF